MSKKKIIRAYKEKLKETPKEEREKKGAVKSKSIEVELVLPKYDNSGNPLSLEFINDFIDEFATEVNSNFSIIPNIYGCWKSEKDGKVYCEENWEIVSAIDVNKETTKKLENLEEIVKDFGIKAGQETMFYVVDDDNTSFVVSGKKLSTSPYSMKKIKINVLNPFIHS